MNFGVLPMKVKAVIGLPDVKNIVPIIWEIYFLGI
tara:strand:+ start:508 stop:612 length:105 start_codon:yes stop_codon:yes gene_type:complete